MPPKPHLRRKADGSLPTASEVARQRKLSEIGKDLVWYYQQVDASRNEHNEPTCEECHLPEKKKLPTGEIKSLTIDTKNVRLVCDSCAHRAYKQRMKDTAAQRQNIDGAQSLEAFWTRNRNKLSEAQIARYEERHIDTILLAEEVELVIQAFHENLPFVESGLHGFIREVCQDIIDHGFIIPDIAVVPFHKPEYADLYALWTSGQNVALEYRKSMPIYMQFGFYHAIPENTVHRFFEQVERYLGLPSGNFTTTDVRIQRILDALEGNVYRIPDRVISCATPKCQATQTIGPYEKLQAAEWFCPACEAVRNAQAHAKLKLLLDQKLKDSRLAKMVQDAEDRASRDALYGEDGRY